MFAANYQLSDTANRVLKSGTVTYEEGSSAVAEQHFAAKIADKVAASAASTSYGTTGALLAPPPPIPPSSLPVPPGFRGIGLFVHDVPSIIASAMGKPNLKGALVLLVLSGSPAEKAGLVRGDVIISANGTPVNSAADLHTLVLGARPGSTLRLGVLRGKTSLTIVAQKPEG
ncbi:MAG: S1C family serine protease [Acidiferrobacter sp.]